jgi:hypothetical protein
MCSLDINQENGVTVDQSLAPSKGFGPMIGRTVRVITTPPDDYEFREQRSFESFSWIPRLWWRNLPITSRHESTAGLAADDAEEKTSVLLAILWVAVMLKEFMGLSESSKAVFGASGDKMDRKAVIGSIQPTTAAQTQDENSPGCNFYQIPSNDHTTHKSRALPLLLCCSALLSDYMQHQ